MKMNRVVALIGFLAYVASFFLIAVRETTATSDNAGFVGYRCAFIALVSPWGHSGMEILHENPLGYFGVLLSGWINPVFLVTAAMLWARPHGRAGAFLRIVLILMLPAVWLVFREMQLRPRAGYWLWTAGMLVVLFSTMLAQKKRDVNVAAVAA
jgi:hypothetical protein